MKLFWKQQAILPIKCLMRLLLCIWWIINRPKSFTIKIVNGISYQMSYDMVAELNVKYFEAASLYDCTTYKDELHYLLRWIAGIAELYIQSPAHWSMWNESEQPENGIVHKHLWIPAGFTDAYCPLFTLSYSQYHDEAWCFSVYCFTNHCKQKPEILLWCFSYMWMGQFRAVNF